MWIIYNILLILFFSTLLMTSIFVIEKIKTTQWFLKTKIININRLFIEGFIYGAIFLSINLLFDNIYITSISFWLIGFFILSTLRETTISVISLVPSTIYYLFVRDINISIFLMYSLIFVMSISFKLALFFSDNFTARIVNYPLFFLVSIVTWFIVFSINHDPPYINSINEIVFTTIGAILAELIVFWLLKTSVSANILYDSINFAFSKYYRSQIMEKAIGEIIKKEKIRKALYIIFDIHVDTEKINEKQEVIETILKDLEKELPQITIFFQSINNKYGAFLKFDENLNIKKLIDDNYNYNPHDNLNFLRILLKKLSTNYKLKNNQIINAYINAGISIYGVQSYSLKKLEMNSNFILDYIKDNANNPIAVFDPIEFNKRKNDINDLLILNEAIDLSSLKLRFSPIYGTDNINIAEFVSSNEEEFIKSISEYVYGYGLIDIYNRYLAAMAIIASKDFEGQIAIPYSFKEFGKLDINRFNRRLKIMNTNLSKLIFIFHSVELKKNKKSYDLMQLFRKNGAKFAFISLQNNDQNLIDYFKPEYIFAKRLENINLKWETIFTNVENEIQLDKAIKMGVKKFSGNLISSNSVPHILSKQSKMYIEKKK